MQWWSAQRVAICFSLIYSSKVFFWQKLFHRFPALQYRRCLSLRTFPQRSSVFSRAEGNVWTNGRRNRKKTTSPFCSSTMFMSCAMARWVKQLKKECCLQNWTERVNSWSSTIIIKLCSTNSAHNCYVNVFQNGKVGMNGWESSFASTLWLYWLQLTKMVWAICTDSKHSRA